MFNERKIIHFLIILALDFCNVTFKKVQGQQKPSWRATFLATPGLNYWKMAKLDFSNDNPEGCEEK